MPSLKAQEIVDILFAQPLLEMALLPEYRHSNELVMARSLVAYLRRIDGEIRSLPSREFSQDTWPHDGIPAKLWWKWATVLSFPWHQTESYNVMEASALLHTLRWSARTRLCVGSQRIHLLDSQVVLGALRKFRSSYPDLNRVITRCASITLASSSKVIFVTYLPLPTLHVKRPEQKKGGETTNTGASSDEVCAWQAGVEQTG